MSAKRVNIDEFSDDNIQEASGTKKVKVQKEGSEVNLFQQANQVSQSLFSKSPQDQDTTLSQSTDIMINDHRRPKKKQKSSSTSIGEVLKNEYINDPTSYVDTYQSLKYKDYLYKLDDNLLIRNESDSNNDFICKLTRIIRPINLSSSKAIAFLEVQWYYKKNDLPKKYEQNLSCIGEAEVFLTNQKDFVMVDCINGLGQVLTYDEYDSLSKIVPNTYFTRGKFDISKKKVYPPFEKWEKHCICKTPLNPDYMYIQCDQCKMWFHIECLQLSSEQAQAMETYICDACNTKKKENTNDIQGDEQKELASANKESKESNLTSKEKVNVSNDAGAVPIALNENKMTIENNADNGTSGEAINSSFNNQDSEKDQNQEKAQNS